MACVLVTGATGFIGLHLVESLAGRGQTVRCLVRPTSQTQRLAELGVELRTVDFGDQNELDDAVTGVDVVYHLAGATRALWPCEFDFANRECAGRMAQACANQPTPPRLVLVSSVAAAGPAPRGRLRVESDPSSPVSRYGQSKLAGELAAQRFAANVPLTIVRPGIVFGPRDRAVLKILKTIRLLGFHPSPGLSPPPLSYIHVADLVEMLQLAAEHGSRVAAATNGHPGQGRYFAVAPEYPTYAEFGRLAGPMLVRRRTPVLPVAGPVAWCIAGISECVARLRGQPQELGFDKIRDALAPSWACSGEAARRDLGFLPARPLAQRLQETVDWYLAEKWL